jgi:hypothetical protein
VKLLEHRPAAIRDEPSPPPEVIIEEARRRGRWRRSLIGLSIVLVVALGLGLGFGFGGGDGAGNGQASASGAGGTGAARGATLPPRSSLADVGATPPGWAAVPLRGIQVSVPASWQVAHPGQTYCGQLGGVVFLGSNIPSTEPGCAQAFATNAVSLRTGSQPAPPESKQMLIHGLKVTLITEHRTGTEIAYVNGMTVTASGPLAAKVMRTITRSPRSVVLGPYRASVPRSWRHVDFGGLSFSVPERWALQRATWIGGCPYNIDPSTLVLSTARSLFAPGCPMPPSTTGYMAAREGMKVFAGPAVPSTRAQLRGAKCRSLNGLRVCVHPYRLESGYSATNYPGLLTADVYLPGRARPDLVEIGLNGSGTMPLSILDSLRTAR